MSPAGSVVGGESNASGEVGEWIGRYSSSVIEQEIQYVGLRCLKLGSSTRTLEMRIWPHRLLNSIAESTGDRVRFCDIEDKVLHTV